MNEMPLSHTVQLILRSGRGFPTRGGEGWGEMGLGPRIVGGVSEMVEELDTETIPQMYNTL